MSTITPVQFRPISGTVIPTPELVEKWGRIYKRGGFLDTWNVGRGDLIRMMGIAKGSQLDSFYVGPPGVGKTWLIELDLLTIPGAKLFDQLLMKDMSTDDVLGPRSMKALREDRLVRVTDGFLPEANVAYLDEWDKSNSTTVNGLLDITSKRSMKVGGTRVDCSQLLIIFFSGNAMPDREDLTAIVDRLAVKRYVDRMTTPEQRKAVMKIQLEYRARGIDPNTIPSITLEEWQRIKEEAKHIDMPDAVIDQIIEALTKFDAAGHPPTDRKVGQTMAGMQMSAWTDGRSEVQTDDLMVAADMWWNLPEQRKTTEDIIYDMIGGFAREAKATREAMEPIVAGMQKLKQKIADAEQMDDLKAASAARDEVYDLMPELRRLREETLETIRRGDDEARDTTTLHQVIDEIKRAEKWAQEAFMS